MSRRRQLPRRSVPLPAPDARGLVVRQKQTVFENEVFGRRVLQGGTAASPAATGNWVPSVDGSEPPNFITDGAGNLIFVWYQP